MIDQNQSALESQRFVQGIYGELARIGKALGSPGRLMLLDLLSQGPRTVEGLAQASGLSVANTSRHLQALKTVCLVEAARDGQYVNYRLADEEVSGFLVKLRGLGRARLAQIERATREFLDERDPLEPVDASALMERARTGEVTVLDVRPGSEYEAGHLPGALSIPIDELERRLSELPPDRAIVAYCRGPYCCFAVDAVRILRAHGREAQRLDEGMAEWKAMGQPVEMSASRGGGSQV